jgi:hypothetical protein
MPAAGEAEDRGAGAEPAGGPPPPEPSRLALELREGRTPPTLAAVLIAWAITLAPSGFGRGASLLTGTFAVAALGAGIGGALLSRRKPRTGRHVGISLFAALAALTWLADGHAIHPLRLDPIRGLLGAVAWGVFALSWSERWGSHVEPVPVDPDAPLLLPRSSLPPLSAAIAVLGVTAALGFLAIAFQIRDPDRALVSQAIALACAVAVVTAAGVVATARGKARSSSGRRLTPPVVRALLLLVTAAIAGAVITALRVF